MFGHRPGIRRYVSDDFQMPGVRIDFDWELNWTRLPSDVLKFSDTRQMSCRCPADMVFKQVETGRKNIEA